MGTAAAQTQCENCKRKLSIRFFHETPGNALVVCNHCDSTRVWPKKK